MSKISAYTEHTAPSGDDDYLVINDATTTKKVKAKNATGGMLAHGDGVKSFYRYTHFASDGVKYYKIAQSNTTSLSAGTIRLKVYIDSTSDLSNTIEIILNNRNAKNERVLSISSEDKSNLAYGGIRTYVETDTSLSVYIYFVGTGNIGVSAELVSSGYANLSAVYPPNDITAITSPTGTLSLDTTAGKYANGVPDGNEDWIAPTLLNSWVDYGSGYNNAGYMRDSDGWVNLRGMIATGTTTSGTDIFILPAGYRPSGSQFHTISSNDAFAIVQILSSGVVEIWSGASATWLSLEGLRFKAEA